MRTLIIGLIILFFGSTAFAQLKSNQLRLTVSVNALSDQTIIRFDSSATENFDSQEDAYKMMNSQNSPSLYSSLNNVDYSINTLPTNFQQIAVPVNLAAPIAGNYTISAAQVHPFDSIISITFVDSLNGTTQDLKVQTAYNFTLSARDTLINRFYIIFTKDQPVNTTFDTVTVLNSDTITATTSDTAQASSADTSASISNMLPSTPDTTSTATADTTISAPSDTITITAVSDSTISSDSLGGSLPKFNSLLVTTPDTSANATDTTNVSTPGSSSLQSVTAVVPTADNGNDIKIYGYGDQVTIANGNTYSIDGSIVIYNMQGQILLEQQSVHVANNADYKISINAASNDIYIVSLATTSTTVSQRIVLGN